MLIPTIAIGASLLMLFALVYSRTNPLGADPSCPSCQVALIELPRPVDEVGRTYDVLACPECTNTITRVLGAQSRFAWCPHCNQRTLETPVTRLPPTPQSPMAAEVAETCHVCGYDELRVLPDPGVRVKLGRVIPFPVRSISG